MSQQWICTKCERTITTASGEQHKPKANYSTCPKSSNKQHTWIKNTK